MKYIRKLISILLILSTLYYQFLPITAFALNNSQIDNGEIIGSNSTENQHNGTIELDIKFVLPIQNIENPNIQVKLIKGENEAEISLNQIIFSDVKEFSLGNQKGSVKIRKMDKFGEVMNGTNGEEIKYYALTFQNLPKGNYTLELSGDGYKTYTIPNINIDHYSKRVSLSNEKGLFEVGDINQDQLVDNQDLEEYKNILLENLEYNSKYDLNRDNKLDISDLAIIARVINMDSKTIEMKDTSVILDQEDVTLSGEIDGTLEDLFNDYSSVQIKPLDQNQEISEENPAQIALEMKEPVEMEEIRLDVSSDNIPEEMCVVLTDNDGNIITTKDGKECFVPTKLDIKNENSPTHPFTDKETENTITIDLEGQIAVKKVTIKITKTSSKNLAEIAKVEFLNNVYEEVPETIVTAPIITNIEAASEKATITYRSTDSNITGYEIIIKKYENDQVVETNTYQTNYTTYEIEELENYGNYTVQVVAVNEEWRSKESEEKSFMPKPNRLPPAVDMVTVTPRGTGFDISYKKMDDTLSYNIYYREVGQENFTKISDIKTNSYQLRNLKEETEYEIYVTGNNDLGEGSKSETAIGKTIAMKLPDSSNYKLINRPTEIGKLTDHILGVTYSSNKYEASDIAIVDNDYFTYWQSDSWDVGGYNNLNAGPTITLDQEYTIDHVEIVPSDESASIFYSKINYWTKDGERKQVKGNVSRLTAPNGQIYYRITFEKVTTSKIQINVANYLANGNTVMREVKIFEYDSLIDDVGELFSDDLRVELKNTTTEEKIKELENRANTIEEISGEYHPNREIILKDLEYARELLNDKNLHDEIITVDQEITNARNSHLGFAMEISDLQPLGIVAKAGEDIVVYVGATGNVLPQLVFTQYNAEASAWQQTVTNLKKGQNIITVPKIGSMATERGGSVYVRYPNKNPSGEIKVRVSGGTKIPVLDVSGITNETEKKNVISNYIDELANYVDQLPSKYETYNAYNAILNSTEIVTDEGLFSVAADQVLKGIITDKKTKEEQIERVYQSVTAFDEMVNMFYRHKGLEKNAEDPKDERPAARINIRYMRMFDGAFMYAGGKHIGIGYGSIAGLLQGIPATDENGNITTYGYFGWGISHEIGHQINQRNLAIAEVTNNIYSLLAQTADDKETARIEELYEKIYAKVTSNTSGKASNVFITLAMYWQLHLAYDNNKTFTDTDSIYAKINHLSRTTELKGTVDDMIIMLASEAAQKDLTEFFEHWGLVPSSEAKEYASQYEKETRKIWYLNDDARRYRLNSGKEMSKDTKVEVQFTETDSQNKKFTIKMNVNKDEDTILGYEIKRNNVVIGFTTENTFTDNIGSLNNRALVYEVTAYDKYLNATDTYQLEEVKVAHDGSINKSFFSIDSNFKETDEIFDYEDPYMNYDELSVNKIIDNDKTTYFDGTEKIDSNNKDNPYIIISLNNKLDISGIKYQAALKNQKLLENTITKYNVYVSTDKETWILAKTGTFNLSADKDTEIIYFDKEGTTGGNQLWTYNDISYVKIEAVGNNGISGAEIDIIAPPGDNVDLDDIGVLSEDYSYIDSNGETKVIAKGNVIVKGTYRGNPAFNAMLLVDAIDSDKVYEGDNFLFAKLNDDATLYEISSGTWFYVLTKEQYDAMKGTSIRAELYRVNDAITNEGQRLTSTSLKVDLTKSYEELPQLEIIDSTKGE